MKCIVYSSKFHFLFIDPSFGSIKSIIYPIYIITHSNVHIIPSFPFCRDRIAPADDPIRPCQPDTAAKPDANDPSKISVARPLQSNHKAHFKVFCECQDWRSKWDEDKEWCRNDQSTRLYDQPYNFKTDGF